MEVLLLCLSLSLVLHLRYPGGSAWSRYFSILWTVLCRTFHLSWFQRPPSHNENHRRLRVEAGTLKKVHPTRLLRRKRTELSPWPCSESSSWLSGSGRDLRPSDLPPQPHKFLAEKVFPKFFPILHRFQESLLLLGDLLGLCCRPISSAWQNTFANVVQPRCCTGEKTSFMVGSNSASFMQIFQTSQITWEIAAEIKQSPSVSIGGPGRTDIPTPYLAVSIALSCIFSRSDFMLDLAKYIMCVTQEKIPFRNQDEQQSPLFVKFQNNHHLEPALKPNFVVSDSKFDPAAHFLSCKDILYTSAKNG